MWYVTTVLRQWKTLVFVVAFSVFTNLVFGYKNVLQIGSIQQAEYLQRELQRYNDIERKGGWQKIIVTKKDFRKGESATTVQQLKKRLAAFGDYTANDTSTHFSTALEATVKKVQLQFGLTPTGIVDAALLKALNVPVENRRQQLEINLARLQTSTVKQVERMIVVNVPEYKLHVYENGGHLFDMNVVVGAKATPTVTFDDELTHIVFSPYWNVPTSIVKNELLPKMKKNRQYLSANGYELTGTEGGLPAIRQKPGKGNALGQVKFLFPNPHDIYFHDTPFKSHFSNSNRAKSHGCIRLSDPKQLAAYLLKDAADWTPSKIEGAMQSSKEQWVKLILPVTVSIVYYKAWIDKKGALHFRDDVYGLDNAVIAASVTR